MTTADYFLELQQQHYTAFLNWPRFLVNQKYPMPQDKQHADCVMMILLYEWLNHGFEREHYEPVYLLAYMYFNNQLSMPEGDGYAITLLATVIVQAMIIKASNQFKPMISEPTADNIIIYMKQLFELLPDAMNEAIRKQQQILDSWAKDQALRSGLIKHQFLEHIRMHGKQVVSYGANTPDAQSYMHLLEMYLNRLTCWSATDRNTAVRKGLISSLLGLLREKEPTEHPALIKTYVNKINSLKPEPWEQDILNKIYQPSILSTWWEAGKSIFSVLSMLSQSQNTKAIEPK